jgi:hypothetical protein
MASINTGKEIKRSGRVVDLFLFIAEPTYLWTIPIADSPQHMSTSK